MIIEREVFDKKNRRILMINNLIVFENREE